MSYFKHVLYLIFFAYGQINLKNLLYEFNN